MRQNRRILLEGSRSLWERESMDVDTVAVPMQGRPGKRSAALLSVIRELWDLQPSRSEDISLEELERTAAARNALRVGNAAKARDLLQNMRSPEALNLVGISHELLGDHRKARAFYQEALSADTDLYAAELNLRRSFELWELGECGIPIAL